MKNEWVLFNPHHIELNESYSELESYFSSISPEQPEDADYLVLIDSIEKISEFPDNKIIYIGDISPEELEKINHRSVAMIGSDFFKQPFHDTYLKRFLGENSSIHLSEMENFEKLSIKLSNGIYFGHFQDVFLKGARRFKIDHDKKIKFFQDFINLFYCLERKHLAQFPLDIDIIFSEDVIVLQGHVPAMDEYISDDEDVSKAQKLLLNSSHLLDFYTLESSEKIVCTAMISKECLSKNVFINSLSTFYFSDIDDTGMLGGLSYESASDDERHSEGLKDLLGEIPKLLKLKSRLNDKEYNKLKDGLAEKILNYFKENLDPQEEQLEDFSQALDGVIHTKLDENEVDIDKLLDKSFVQVPDLKQMNSVVKDEDLLKDLDAETRKIHDDNFRLKHILREKDQYIERLSKKPESAASENNLNAAKELYRKTKAMLEIHKEKYTKIIKTKEEEIQKLKDRPGVVLESAPQVEPIASNEISESDKAEIVKTVEKNFQLKLDTAKKVTEKLQEELQSSKKMGIGLINQVKDMEKEIKTLKGSVPKDADQKGADGKSLTPLDIDTFNETIRNLEEKLKHADAKIKHEQDKTLKIKAQLEKAQKIGKEGSQYQLKLKQLEITHEKLVTLNDKNTKDLADKRKEAHQYKTELNQLQNKLSELERKTKKVA